MCVKIKQKKSDKTVYSFMEHWKVTSMKRKRGRGWEITCLGLEYCFTVFSFIKKEKNQYLIPFEYIMHFYVNAKLLFKISKLPIEAQSNLFRLITEHEKREKTFYGHSKEILPFYKEHCQ